MLTRLVRSRHGLPLFGYALLTAIVTWPVLPRFLTYIPGGGDAAWFLWQLWWFKHALLDLRQLPYQTYLIYYPITDVPVTAQTPFNEIFTLPLQIAIGLTPLYNLLFVLSYLLSGYFTYLLGLALTRRRSIAFVGGVIFAFCAYRGMRGLGHLSLLTTQWLPLALLLAIQCWRHPTWPRGVATGIATALVALSSPYYVGLFLLPVVSVGGLYLLLAARGRLWRGALWRVGVLAGGVALLLAVPFYLPMLVMLPAIDTVNQDLAQSAWRYSADLLSWLLPAGFHPIWGRYTAPIYANFTTPNMMETTLFLGFIPLLLALFTLILPPQRRSLRYWQMIAMVTFVLAFGPSLHVAGREIVDGLPFQWLLALPGFELFRIPSRAGITTMLAVSVLTMLALSQIRCWFAPHLWQLFWPVLTAIILVNITPLFPYPTTKSSIPGLYRTLAAQPQHAALLELPDETVRDAESFFAAMSWYMYYQTEHQRPVVSGYLGRRPARLTYPEEHMPFVRQFFQWDAGKRQVTVPPLTLMPEPFWPDEIWRGQEVLARQGIQDVLLHCTAPATCRHTRLLLQQALGSAANIDAAIHHYQAPLPTYRTAYVPAYLVTPPVYFDDAFTPVTVDPEGRRHSLLTPQGAITLSVPFTGLWSIRGRLTGNQADQLTFAVDGQPVDPVRIQQDADGLFQWQQLLPAGEHKIQLTLPALSAAQAANCTNFCLYNLHLQLVDLLGPSPRAPLATFVNEAGAQLQLVTLTFFTLLTAGGPSQLLLAATWQLDDQMATLLRDSPADLPVNYLHFTDSAGNVLAQADHPLGERHIILDGEHRLIDLIPVPPAPANQPFTELRLGLWYPATQSYFWSPDGDVDENGRVRIGKLTDFYQPFPLPPLPNNSALATDFHNSADGRTLRLLDASLTLNPTTNQLQLATIWEQKDLFIPGVSVTLIAHLTNREGASLAREAHLLGSQQLTWHSGYLRYDLLDLPAAWLDRKATGEAEVRIELLYLDTGQRYAAERTDLVDGEGRFRLGTVADLLGNPVDSP